MLGNLNVYAKLDAMTATEKKLLKKCLGDADGDSNNNVEVYDWDYGAASTGVRLATRTSWVARCTRSSS